MHLPEALFRGQIYVCLAFIIMIIIVCTFIAIKIKFFSEKFRLKKKTYIRYVKYHPTLNKAHVVFNFLSIFVVLF